MESYADRLDATKAHYPFERWLARGDDLEQYTEETCGQAAEIFDRLIVMLGTLGEGASEAQKLAAFQEAVEALNALNEENFGMLIETEEREQLCELCNVIAVAAAMDPKRYGGGEGPASQWRDW